MSKIYTRRRNKKWEYRFNFTDSYGEVISKSKCGFSTKKEALEAGNLALNDYLTGKISTKDYTIKDLYKIWHDNYAVFNLKPATIQTYDSYINNKHSQHIFNRKLNTLKPIECQKYFNELISGGFSSTSCRLYRTLLSVIINYMSKAYDIEIPNPFKKVKINSFTTSNSKALTKEDVAKILHFSKKEINLFYIYKTLYLTGLRMGEALALDWSDVDFDNNKIHIHKTLSFVQVAINGSKKFLHILNNPKTPSSIRAIDMSESLANHLLEYKKYQYEQKNFYGDFYQQNYIITVTDSYNVKRTILTNNYTDGCDICKPVFRVESGRFMTYYYLSDNTKKVSKTIGIKFSCHSFRHTHATLLLENGMPIKSIQHRLGHSNTSITLNTYSHVTKSMDDKLVNNMDKILE